MNCDIIELDVFGTGAFTGNPVAVVGGAEGLTAAQMRRIASWLNYSETTFLLSPTRPGADYRVRIFFPAGEFDFAGHPTLGTAAAWLELGGRPAGEAAIVQECAAGLVPVRVEGSNFSFAAPPLERSGPLSREELREVLGAFGLSADDVVDAAWGDNGPGWRLVQLRDVHTLRSLRQPTKPVKTGFAAFGGAGDWLYEVRAFSLDREDPVTGSLNGALAQWLRGRGAVPARYAVSQGRAVGRDGRVEIFDDGSDIWVGGRVEVRVRGTIRV
ncbi:PhzF family phenazine biosynthesis protein [Corynebacterium sp. UBA2622]|uniref:PhzF family phenazine biosynthesis protein n=1 Tax=Corynebacterium sp. UBA2622 TaxID=1946393 RepID=UPI0025C079D2|nr:PhzF family phenazine biosynthesis protein [Corynebacterium sp. UBA2622]